MLSRSIARTIAILGMTAAAASGANAQNAVKIGMVMPMTGTLASAGQQVIAGARLYIKQHGDTVAGRQIELIVKDNASSGENGKRLIQELIVNEKVDVIGGGQTADLLPSAPLLTEAQKPAVIMISSTTAVVEKSPYFVRTSGTLAQSSAIMADWAMRNGIGKAVTLVTEFAPGLEAEETFTNNFKAAGGQIAETIRVPLRSPDFAPFLQRVRDAAPQAVFVFIPSSSGRHLRQAVRGARPRQGRHQADRARRPDRRRSTVEHGRRHAGHRYRAFLLRRASLRDEQGLRRRIPEGQPCSRQLHGGERLRRHACDL